MGSPIQLTELGEIVYGQDPELSSLVSMWFMHHNLSASPENAEVWHWFSNEFLSLHKQFLKSDLEMGIAKKLMPHDARHFAVGSTMTRVIVRKLIDCYISSDALGDLEICSEVGKNRYRREEPLILGPWPTRQLLLDEFQAQ